MLLECMQLFFFFDLMNQNVIVFNFITVQFSTIMSKKGKKRQLNTTLVIWLTISFSSTLNQNVFKFVMGGGR